MKITINTENYILTWLKLVIGVKLNIYLTKREYELLSLIAGYKIVALKERKEISGKLNCSEQVISNYLKALKDKGLIEYSKKDKSYNYSLKIPVPNNIDDLINLQDRLEFTLKQN